MQLPKKLKDLKALSDQFAIKTMEAARKAQDFADSLFADYKGGEPQEPKKQDPKGPGLK